MRILYFLSSILLALSSVQFSHSVMSDSLRSMDYSTPGFAVHHQLLELVQTHAHWVSDAIQPSHPLSPPSPPAFSLSQHQGLFQWVSSSHQVAKGLEEGIRIVWTLEPIRHSWNPNSKHIHLCHLGRVAWTCSHLLPHLEIDFNNNSTFLTNVF